MQQDLFGAHEPPPKKRAKGRVVTESIPLPFGAAVLGKHPAKMHPDLARALIVDYSDPGGLVVDPFCGIGTTLWAARVEGRRAVATDVERGFAAQAAQRGAAVLGDARKLPLPDGCADMVLTSPPYGDAVGRAGDRDPKKTAANKARYEQERFGRVISDHAVYGFDERNLGTKPRDGLDSFRENMPRVMAEIARVLKPDRVAAVVVKDQRLGRRRLGTYDLPADVVQWGAEAGLVFHGRRYGLIPEDRWTLWQRTNAKRWGHPIPDVEQVIVLLKPSQKEKRA